MAEKAPQTSNPNPDPSAEPVPPGSASSEDGGSAAASASSSAPADGDGGDPSPASTPKAEGEGSSSVGGEPSPAEPKEDPNAWKAKKYDKVFARLRETEEKLAAATAAKADPDGKPGLTQADVDAKAAQLAALAEFNRHCNQVAATATKSFPDFKDRINNLRQIILDEDDRAAYNQMVNSALELGDEEAGRILYALGGNLDEANRIMALKPARQGIELARMAAQKGEPEPSGAPKPITPVTPKGAVGEQIRPDDPVRADKLSKAEWFKRRQADVDKRRAAGERIW